MDELTEPKKAIFEAGEDGRRRVVIEALTPSVDAGRFSAKRTIGDTVEVGVDIFTDGHDSIAAVVRHKKEGAKDWIESPLTALVNDRWTGKFLVDELGRYVFTVVAWIDHWETWLRDLRKRIQADSDTPIDYLIGADLMEQAGERASGDDAKWLRNQAKGLREKTEQSSQRALALDEKLNGTMQRYPDRRFATEYEYELVIVVDPVRARFSSWYEFFPRSASPEPGRHGTFADCEARLPYIAGMGFDVVYLPPIHPIGTKFRKGKNNSVVATLEDVGSPWAIGAADGGHKAVHSDLGTLEDFRRFVEKAAGTWHASGARYCLPGIARSSLCQQA